MTSKTFCPQIHGKLHVQNKDLFVPLKIGMYVKNLVHIILIIMGENGLEIYL